jgi:hypothetical protein
MHCPSAMESVVPYFTIKCIEKNGTAQGLCAQRPGRSFGFAASSRTSDGAGSLALCLKKDESEKTTLSPLGSIEGLIVISWWLEGSPILSTRQYVSSAYFSVSRFLSAG